MCLDLYDIRNKALRIPILYGSIWQRWAPRADVAEATHLSVHEAVEQRDEESLKWDGEMGWQRPDAEQHGIRRFRNHLDEVCDAQ